MPIDKRASKGAPGTTPGPTTGPKRRTPAPHPPSTSKLRKILHALRCFGVAGPWPESYSRRRDYLDGVRDGIEYALSGTNGLDGIVDVHRQEIQQLHRTLCGCGTCRLEGLSDE